MDLRLMYIYCVFHRVHSSWWFQNTSWRSIFSYLREDDLPPENRYWGDSCQIFHVPVYNFSISFPCCLHDRIIFIFPYFRENWILILKNSFDNSNYEIKTFTVRKFEISVSPFNLHFCNASRERLLLKLRLTLHLCSNISSSI